jgi:hypothetical protein
MGMLRFFQLLEQLASFYLAGMDWSEELFR